MKHFFIITLAIALFYCKPKSETLSPTESTHYPISPIDIRNVKLTDDFWLPIIKTIQNTTIQYALEKCREEGRMDNFLIAGGVMEGETRGVMPFDDTDLYKIIEGASYSLISNPDTQLDAYLDTLISIIKTGQEEDGYLTTWRTINGMKPPAPWVNPGNRWEHLAASHELYNSGHMFEAAAAHYRATGKTNFLDIATKNADLLVTTFGMGKLELVPGHQIVETGLIKLYQITGNENYLNLSRFYLDARGDSTTHKLYGAYNQDHLPVTQQDEAVGHSVRAVYMYAGMTDIAAIQHDVAYRTAVDKLWENMVYKKLSITGGIGARHEGEAFGDNYELPNLTAYNETCAAIGSVYWNHRLFLLTGESKYYDVIERTLYNGVIPGISLDGVNFFYPNALESDGKYTFNQGACTRKSWFDCSCCPTNMIRFLPSVPGLIYAQQKDTLYVNLYATGSADLQINEIGLNINQTTEYPWNGHISIGVNPEKIHAFSIKLRVPGWARNEVLPSDLYTYDNTAPENPTFSINGEPLPFEPENGYITISRQWQLGDEITMELPMSVRLVKANDLVTEDQNKRSLEYGPLVYCAEEADNPATIDQLSVNANPIWTVVSRPDLLNGVKTISWKNSDADIGKVAIPYYAWSNRGIGKMKVWIPFDEK
ncbi:MAG: glycoside hydrolase family 127 protein [Cyclobacteriaceae bacterium]|nr:glycoside hydrolase family 127 protein [Cyclobacteriaceae bacterium]